MAPFWKSRPKFLRFGKKKKDKQVQDLQPLPLDYNPYAEPVQVDEDGRSPGSGATGDSWKDFPRQTEEQMREQEVHVYEGPDALSTMNELLSYEVQGSPQSHPYQIPRTPDGYEHPHHSRAKSLGSLSTISATVRGHNASMVGTAEEIDLMVRQSMASRGQPISVAVVDPVDVPPVPRIPEHLEHSEPEHEYTIPPVFEPPPAESTFTGDAGGIPLVESPISYATPLPVPPPPISSSAQTAPRSSIRSVPNRFRGPYSEHSDHIEMPEPSRSSHPITPVHNIIPQPLTPIQNIIQPLQPQESHHPESIEIQEVQVNDGKVYRSSTGKSTVPTIRSRTYQRALTQPTRLPDPMPRFNPTLLAPPKPRLPSIPSVHRSFISSIRVEETDGLALAEARRALYGSHRKAYKRFFWNLLPQHDERVVQGLARLERIPDSVANLGFVKFLETRSRGALMVNLDHIAQSDADFPAADWITFAQAQKTFDYTLQESIATYDPAVKTLVFVFLLSRSKNSLGIWRRQFPVPEGTREVYGSLLQDVKNELANKELLVHVEATPNNPHGTRSDIGRQPSRRATTRRPTSRRTAPPGPTGPLIFNYQTTEVKTPEQVEVLPMPNAQTATITGTTVHEFGPTGRKSSVVHVFGQTPENPTLSPVYEEEEPPKKKGWFKRMFGPKPKSKTMDETTLGRPRGSLRKPARRKGKTLTRVEWD